jgi:putative Holliday junction resolvase
MGLKDKRLLGIDWGSRRIGLAISDPTQTIASPLGVIKHVSRGTDAKAVLEIAESHQAERIVIGVTYDLDQSLSPVGRSCARFADQIRSMTRLPVELWDEDHSTAMARQSAFEMSKSRKKRSGHLDAAAAAIILQSYLDSTNDAK